MKSKSAGTWELSEDSSYSVILAHVENNFHASGFQAVLNPLISQSVTGATSWKLIRSWVTSRNDGQAGPFNLGMKLNTVPFQCYCTLVVVSLKVFSSIISVVLWL